MASIRRVVVIGLVLLVVAAFGASAQAKVKAAFVVSNMANESQAFSAKQFLKFGSEYGFDMYTYDAKGDTRPSPRSSPTASRRSSRSFSSIRTTSMPSFPA